MNKSLRSGNNNQRLFNQFRKFSSVSKLFCVVAFFFVGFSTSAQTVMLTESFESNTFPPAGWTIINAGSGYGWNFFRGTTSAQSGFNYIGCYNNPNYAANAWAFTPTVNLTQGVTYRLTYWYAEYASGASEKMKVTIGNGNTVASQTTVLHDYTSIANSAYVQGVDTFTVSTSGSYNIAFNCYTLPAYNGQLMLDNIVLQQLSPCTGTPTAGNVTAPAEVCSGTPFTLNMSGTYTQLGYTFQWQSSPAGTNNFANIPGANAQTLTTSQTTSKDYRCVVLCSYSGLSAVSNTVSVTTSLFPCYCKPTSNCAITIDSVQFGSISNLSSGCGTNGFSDFTKTIAAASVNAGTKVPISVKVSSPLNIYVGVWIDYDHSQTFDTSEFKLLNPVNASLFSDSIRLPSNVLPGPITMRVRARYSTPLTASDACLSGIYGETEDYTVDIVPAKVSVFFTPFADSIYTPTIALTANLKQSSAVGINNTDSLKPRLWIKKYNSSEWKVIKGVLASGTLNDGNWQFVVNHDSLGIRRNGCDSVQFYFVAQDADTPPNFGYAPEEGGLHSNVQTQITAPRIPFGYRLIPRLKDTVFVNNADCRFQSLTNEKGLFQYINEKTLEGDLTVMIESDLTEQSIYAIVSTSLNGHRLTIRPDAAVLRTINASGSSFVTIKLDNLKNVLIDGSYQGAGQFLKFKNPTAVFNDTTSNIKIFNSCDSITIRNTIFEHTAYFSNANNTSIWIASGTNSNVVIRDNVFQNISTLTMPFNFIISTDGMNSASVTRNQFNNFLGAGVQVNAPSLGWLIDSNHFFRNAFPSAYSYNFSAIRVYGGGHVISNNYIGGRAPSVGGSTMRFVDNPGSTVSGIETYSYAGNNPPVITNNRIDNIVVTYSSAAQTAIFNGILAEESNAIIKNNIIGNPAATSSTILVVCNSAFGINAYGAQPVDIENNIIAGIEPQRGPSNVAGVTSLYGIWKENNLNGFLASTVPATIAGNKIFNLKNLMNRSDLTNGGTAGIVSKGGSSNRIERNIIHDISVDNYKVSGIYFSECTSGQASYIQRNRIYNLVNNSTVQGSCCTNDDASNGIINGVVVEYDNTFVDILNNQISLTNKNLSNPVTIRGIYEGFGNSSNPQQRVFYNTIYIGGTAAGNGGSAPFVSLLQPVKQIYNNLFYNERTGGTTGHFAFRFPDASASSTIFANTKANHNLYVLPDSSAFAQLGTTPKINWSTWKTRTQGDDSSFIALPDKIPASQFFVDKANGVLNINASSSLSWNVNSKALPFSGITDDFDSVGVRLTAPSEKADIGADEFDTITIDSTTVCGCHCRVFSVFANPGASYQWQVDMGSGFNNIADNTIYTGTNTPVLHLNNAPDLWYGYKYRCVTNASGSLSYSDPETLKFLSVWTGSVSTAWNDPANWSCNTLPERNTDVVINSGLQNYPVVNSNVVIGSLYLHPGATIVVGSGYTLTLTR